MIDDVWSYAREAESGFDHVLRWMRVLTTLGVVEDMTAAEAQGYADIGWERWEPVAEELRKLEDAPGDYQPAQQVIDDVWSYAQETGGGFDHVLRWMRVLTTFGVVEDMTAAEAKGYADNGWERWEPVAEELRKLEDAPGDYQPAQQVIDNVWTYARETESGFDHVLRWMRVLTTLGVVEDMTAAEAQGYADNGWERWEPVAEELAALEASAS